MSTETLESLIRERARQALEDQVTLALIDFRRTLLDRFGAAALSIETKELLDKARAAVIRDATPRAERIAIEAIVKIAVPRTEPIDR